MPSVINTNISSLNTQRNLGASQASLNVAIQRLSTGLRVNSAKDDAAGLAIAERMNAQVKGLSVAARNANDGVSLAQTAEGALGKVGEMVQRIRELAVQSSNATNSTEDRKALQAEVAQLKDEIDRVANTTNFNGTKLLDGSFKAGNFQVGADAGQTITVGSITDAQLSGFKTDYAKATGTGDITATGTNLDAVTDALEFTVDADDDGTMDDVVQVGNLDKAATVEERQQQVVAAINKTTDKHGVSAYVENGAIVMTSAKSFSITDGAGEAVIGIDETADANGTAANKGLAESKTLAKLDITSYSGAQLAIRQADEALKQVNTARAALGAVQSRFENAISNIQISSENTSAARSRIMDTDFAAETANMTRSQILQQAGNAMLSQANQLPQQVLSLLR